MVLREGADTEGETGTDRGEGMLRATLKGYVDSGGLWQMESNIRFMQHLTRLMAGVAALKDTSILGLQPVLVPALGADPLPSYVLDY